MKNASDNLYVIEPCKPTDLNANTNAKQQQNSVEWQEEIYHNRSIKNHNHPAGRLQTTLQIMAFDEQWKIILDMNCVSRGIFYCLSSKRKKYVAILRSYGI